MTEPHIAFGTWHVRAREGESVLDALLRVGAPVAFSCKSGVCHTCALKCTSGHVPPEAQRGLPASLVERHYLLPCRCVPDTSLVLTGRQPEDMLTECQLVSFAWTGEGQARIEFEPARTLGYHTGDTFRVADVPGDDLIWTLVSDPQNDYLLVAEAQPSSTIQVPPGWTPDVEFGTPFVLRGPTPAMDRVAPRSPAHAEIGAPDPDPELWGELGDGRLVRQVLEAFYAKVYADAKLSAFFEGVTKERSIEKQYSFLKQCITGEKCYMGNRPRNAHHWMIISDDLFDYRQALMIETLGEAGLGDDLIARWTRFEEHFRADMVKSAAWARQVGDQMIDTEAFDIERLGVDTVCDYCSAPIEAGTEVRFHRRLGRVACGACQGGATAPLAELAT